MANNTNLLDAKKTGTKKYGNEFNPLLTYINVSTVIFISVYHYLLPFLFQLSGTEKAITFHQGIKYTFQRPVREWLQMK